MITFDYNLKHYQMSQDGEIRIQVGKCRKKDNRPAYRTLVSGTQIANIINRYDALNQMNGYAPGYAKRLSYKASKYQDWVTLDREFA